MNKFVALPNIIIIMWKPKLLWSPEWQHNLAE